ncbi:biotin transporter BioY [[Clostridium] colinum]|uniref:biotin transporter BioY n=1 Tax=[Clostridium] colinum TaxID=36835 RepID=UPI00202400D8|nr:biotin transporter BioY [[Clostridium] colinum]
MKTKDITYIALFSAIISILSVISIPTPWGVPFTLQTFSISLAGFVLGKKYGTLSTILYLILGAIGFPVFSGLTGGVSTFVSVTGGFLFGFIFLAFFCGFNTIFYSIIGLLICHLLGAIQFSFLTKNSFLVSLTIVSLPYLIKDLLSIFLSYFLSKKIKNILYKNNLKL